MSRHVKFFGVDERRTKGSPSEQLEAWLRACDEDPNNEFDIGDPIVYNGIYLLVMYNVEPVAPDPEPPLCNVTCADCGAAKKHYCRACDAGKPVQ